MNFVTCDLCDENPDDVRVCEPMFSQFGGRECFGGEIVTAKCFEDNSRVKETLGTPGQGKVLVVDGGGSLRCALLGDMIGEDAVKNGWEGVIVYGCVRDVDALGTPLMAGPLAPYTPVQGADVAAAMLARARQGADRTIERLRWRDMMTLAGKA